MPEAPIGLLALALVLGCAPRQGTPPSQAAEMPANPAQMERVTQDLVAPPLVPVHD